MKYGFVIRSIFFFSFVPLPIVSNNLYNFYCCSVAKLCPTLCDPMNCSMPGFPVLHYLLRLAQTHVHWVCDAIQPSRPQSSPSPPAFNLSQHQNLCQWVHSLYQVAKILKLQLQHVLPRNIQDWFPLGLIGLISLQSRGLLSLLQHRKFLFLFSL